MRILIALTCIFLLTGCSPQNEEAEPKAVVEVKVAKAVPSDVQLSVTAPATIYPREQASIASKITAPIRALLVTKGDTVAAGQVLARLENRDLVAQRTEALDKALADASSAQAVLAQAEKNLERRQALYGQGAIPARDLLATQTEAAQARATYQAARRYVDLLQTAAPGTANTAEQANAETSTAFLNTQIEFTEIRAPFNGVVTEQFLYPGDMAKPESPIFTVMDFSAAVARAQVPSVQITDVALGQACSFAGENLPDNRSGGRISLVGHVVDPARRTVEIWCELPNARRSLRAGVFGSVTVSIGKAERAIVLPESAVQFEEGSTKGTAILVDQQNVAHVKEVEATPLPGGRVQITHGINAGEAVVIEGGYGLPDGTQVKFAEAAK